MTRRVGPYEVVRELGRGGMGVVYEVRDPALPRRLALKLILDRTDPEALARFGREVELLARVRHPNVVAVHALGRAPEGPFVLMDLIEGEPLARWAGRAPDPARAVALVRALCGAVGALHAQGIVHRDLKPQNVLVRPDGAPVLLDFGLARGGGAESLTRTGAVVGTPRYMAPEQAQGKGLAPLDARADVYGLGTVLFELLAGAPPFAEVEGGPYALLAAVVEREPAWPGPERGVTPALGAALRRALAKRTEERFPTATALDAALGAALDAPAGRPSARAGRGPALAATGALALVLALLALLAAAGGGAALVGERPARPPSGPVSTGPTPAAPGPSPPGPAPPGPPPHAGPAPVVGSAGPDPGATALGAPGPDLTRADRPALVFAFEEDLRDFPALAWVDGRLALGTRGQVSLWAPATPARPVLMFTLKDAAMGLGERLAAGPSDELWCAGGPQLARADLARVTLAPRAIQAGWRTSALARAPDGLLALGAHGRLPADPPRDPQVLLHDPARDALVGRLALTTGSEEFTEGLAFSPAGRHLAVAVGGAQGRPSLRVWARAPWTQVAAWNHPASRYTSLAFAPGASGLLAAGTGGGHLRLFQVEPPAERGELLSDGLLLDGVVPVAHPTRVFALAFSPDGATLFSLGYDKLTPEARSDLRVWDPTARRLLRAVQLRARFVSLAVSPDGRWLALGRVDGAAELWSARALARPE